MTSIGFSLGCRQRGDLIEKNSKERAPGTLLLLGFSGGDRGAPGPTRKRALPHQEKTDLFADDAASISETQATLKDFIQGGSAARPVGN